VSTQTALRITPAALVSILDEEKVPLATPKSGLREREPGWLLRDHPLQRVRSYQVRQDAERSWRHSLSVSWRRSGPFLGSRTRGRQAPPWPCALPDCPCGCSSMCADPSPVGPRCCKRWSKQESVHRRRGAMWYLPLAWKPAVRKAWGHVPPARVAQKRL